MRLPYLQVTQETWGKARALAGALDCDKHRAISLILDLWAWGIDLGPDDEAPTGDVPAAGSIAVRIIAGAVEWTGPADSMVSALVAIGLLEATGNGETRQFRVRGLDRYKRTWEKNKRRKRHDVPETGNNLPVTGTMRAGLAPVMAKPAPQTQTQTQTHIKETEEGPLTRVAIDSVETVIVSSEVVKEFIARKEQAPSLRDRLEGTWLAVRRSKYRWRDDNSVRELLVAAENDWDLIERTWKKALLHPGYPKCNSVTDLARHWNAYAGADPPAAKKGKAAESDKDWSNIPLGADGKPVPF